MDICVGYTRTVSHNNHTFLIRSLSLENVDKKWALNISEPGCCGMSREAATFEKILKGIFRLKRRRY